MHAIDAFASMRIIEFQVETDDVAWPPGATLRVVALADLNICWALGEALRGATRNGGHLHLPSLAERIDDVLVHGTPALVAALTELSPGSLSALVVALDAVQTKKACATYRNPDDVAQIMRLEAALADSRDADRWSLDP